jgi:hypothetical protein
MCESLEIMVKNIVLQLPHLLYCDSPLCQNLAMKFGKHVDSIMIQHPSKFVAWAQTQAELEIMCESGEIMVETIVLQLPHLSYCDLPPWQNLAMKFSKHVDSIMIQHPSKFCGMCTNTRRVRNYVWKWRYVGQKHSTPAPSPVILWFASLSEFNYETRHMPWQHYDPTSNRILWHEHEHKPSKKLCVKVEKYWSKILYCCSLTCRIVIHCLVREWLWNFGKCVDSIMIQHPSKLNYMSTNTSRVRYYVW